jgi:RNA polymerase sigma factor (sigma-70 family)
MSEPYPPDDAALIARCRAGDAPAWEALVKRYQRPVYALVRRTGLDEAAAADVLQTVFLRLLQHLPRIAEPERLHAWIATTAKREAWLHARLQQRHVSTSVTEPDSSFADDGESPAGIDEAPGPDEMVSQWQQLTRVHLALERLDVPCRRLLEALFGADEARYEEVARRLGLPIGSIGPMRARCLAKLRRSIE